MKKTGTFAAMILFLSAAVGARTAAWLYIRRREKELDEYEQLLFSDDDDLDVEQEDPDEDVDEELDDLVELDSLDEEALSEDKIIREVYGDDEPVAEAEPEDVTADETEK